MPLSKEALEIIRANETGDLPPVSEDLAARMQLEAEANDALSRPGQARDDYLRISAMSYDEQDAERENDPEADPALLEDRTMETGHGGERRQSLGAPPPPLKYDTTFDSPRPDEALRQLPP